MKLSIYVTFLITFLILFSGGAYAVDNPAVVIKSGFCDDARCYVKSGTNIFLFDVGSAATKNSLYFAISGQRVLKRVDSCIDAACTGTAKIACETGRDYALTITNPTGLRSEDDSGRLLRGSMTFMCDNDAPKLVADESKVSTGIGDTFFKSYDTVVVRFNVTEQFSPVSVTLDLSNIGGEKKLPGTCVKNGGKWECTAQGTAPEGPVEGKVIAYFSDSAGNTDSTEWTINVLKADENLKVHAWRIPGVAADPPGFNKDLVQDFNKYVFITGMLSANVGGFKIQKIEPTGCHLVGNEGISLDAKSQILFSPMLPTFQMTLIMDQNSFPGDDPAYTYNCTLRIQNSKGSIFLKESEEESFLFTLTAYHTRSTADEIKKQKEDLLNKIKRDSGTWGQIYTYTAIGSTICNAALGMKGTAMTLHGSSIAAQASVLGEPIAQSLDISGNYMSKAGEWLLEKPGGQTMCELMTCSADWQKWVTNLYNTFPGYKAVATAAGRTMGVNQDYYTDPYRSWPIALATGCAPALIYGMQKMNEIDCEYLRCLDKDVQNGFPISQCAQIQSNMQCKHVYGGVVRAFPYANIMQDSMSYLQSMVSNPVALLTTAGSYLACRWAKEGSPMHAPCAFATEALAVPKIVNLVTKVVNAQNAIRKPANYCEQVIQDYASAGDIINPFSNLDQYGMRCDGRTCRVKIGEEVYVRDVGGKWYEATNTNSRGLLEKLDDGEIRQRHIEASTTITVYNPAADANNPAQGQTGDQHITSFLQPVPKGKIPDDELQRLDTEAMRKNKQYQQDKLDEYFGTNSEIANLADSYNRATYQVKYYEDNARLAKLSIDSLMQAGPPDETTSSQIENWKKALRDDELNAELNRKQQQESQGRLDRELKISENYGRYWKNGWDAYSTALGFGRVAYTISSFFNPKADYGGWSDAVDKGFEYVNYVTHYEDQFCKVGPPGYSRVNNLVLNNANGQSKSGAHVEGQKEGPVTDPQGREYYNYLITGAVVPKKGDNFRIKVTVKGEGYKVLREYASIRNLDEHGTFLGYNVTMTDYVNLDDTGQPTIANQRVGNNIIFEFTSSSIITLAHEEKNYDTVCINFDVDDVNDYFSKVYLDGKELCNRIVS